MACGGAATKGKGRFASDENADIWSGKFIADHDKTMIVTIAALYQSQVITCQMKSMDFFVWQERSRERSREFGQPAARLRSSARLQAHTHPARVEQQAARRRSGTGLQACAHAASAGGVNSQSIHDECNAARRKKTRFHGALWLGTGIKGR
jgi:hypothetical protein